MGLTTVGHATRLDRVVALLTALPLVFVFLLPSQSGASFPTYLLALIVLAGSRDRWGEFFEARTLSFLLIGLLAYFSTSVWWSETHPLRGAFSVYTRCLLIATFIVALATCLNRMANSARWLWRAIAVAAGLAAALALVGFHRSPPLDGRLVGFGQLRNSVVAGLAFGAGLIVALRVILADSTQWRVIGAICAVAAGFAIYATGSRNAYLSAAVGVWTLLFTWRAWQSRHFVAWFGAPLIVLAASIAWLAAGSPWADTAFPRGDSFRLEIWRAEWHRLLDHGPWFGLGILTSDDVLVRGLELAHPHNLYLASALQGGMVGLLLLLGLLLCSGRELYRARRLQEARLGAALLTTGMTAYLIDGWELIDKVSISWLLLWVPVGIAMAVRVKSRMEDARDPANVSMVARVPESIGEQR